MLKNVSSGIVTALWIATAAQPSRSDELAISIHNPRIDHAQLQSIAQLGVSVVRIDLNWSAIERNRGIYDWSTYDTLVDRLKHAGLRPLFILDYGNDIYGPSIGVSRRKNALPPLSLEAKAAFTTWASMAASRYHQFDPIWEIWNEPDVSFFWPPQSNAYDYVSLAESTCRSIRGVVPGAKIIAPGLSSKSIGEGLWRSKFLSTVLASNLMNCIDGLSIHPYFYNIDRRLAGFRDHMHRLNDAVRGQVAGRIGIYLTEWGEPSSKNGINEDSQTFVMLAARLFSIDANIDLLTLYSWQDGKSDTFGLTRQDGSTKRAYRALKSLNELIHGSDYAGSQKIGELFNFRFINRSSRNSMTIVFYPADFVLPHTACRSISLLSRRPDVQLDRRTYRKSLNIVANVCSD